MRVGRPFLFRRSWVQFFLNRGYEQMFLKPKSDAVLALSDVEGRPRMTDTKTYTLSQDPKKKDWVLLVKGGKRATKRFASKTDANAKAIRTAVGADGGTVSILKGDGSLQSTLTVKATKPAAKSAAKSPVKKASNRKPAAAKKPAAKKKAPVRKAAAKTASKAMAKPAHAKASRAKPVAKKAAPKKPRKSAAKK